MSVLIYNGDSMSLLAACKGKHIPLMFADPPDNLGLEYHGMIDRVPPEQYNLFLAKLFEGIYAAASVSWLSYYNRHDPIIMSQVHEHNWKKIIWRFTFGQNQQREFGSGYRPILRLTQPGVSLSDAIGAIRIESARQRLGDSRANPEGRVPDDVWDFPRVTGNAIERRQWHPTQHPEALLDRIVQSSYLPGTCRLLIDLFAGTGSMLRVAEHLGIPAIGCEQSPHYCEMMSYSLKNCSITKDLDTVLAYIARV